MFTTRDIELIQSLLEKDRGLLGFERAHLIDEENISKPYEGIVLNSISETKYVMKALLSVDTFNNEYSKLISKNKAKPTYKSRKLEEKLLTQVYLEAALNIVYIKHSTRAIVT